MSMIGLAADSAVLIAERRHNKLGRSVYSGRSRVALERNIMAFRSSNWIIVLSGFVEPIFYLLAFGFGIGKLIGGVTDGDGNPVSYAAFIAPALLATSAMNGAIYDSTWNVFFKMHFAKLYETMLATSLGPLDVAIGEIGWALIRGFVYALGFMAVMAPLGLIPSWWALLAIPGAVLIAFGFASFGMAITSYLKTFHQMNWINFFMLPMFLFSGTFSLACHRTRARIHARQPRLGSAWPRGLLFGNDCGRIILHDSASHRTVHEVGNFQKN
jgi:lipooligosaccharide transport system permease protein